MTWNEKKLSEKRQRFHQLLLALGEVKYKAVIVEGSFGVESTTELNEEQIDTLIRDAELRLGKRGISYRKPLVTSQDTTLKEMRRLRNKCLIALSERGINATTRDWSTVNKELEADRYQWILTDDQRTKGLRNKRGLTAFNTPESLKKLFKQLCSIRDNHLLIQEKHNEIASKN